MTLGTPAYRRANKDRGIWLGSSDAPIVVGLSPYKSAMTLYHEKLGLVDKDETERAVMSWGHILEEPVAQEYAKVKGRHIRRPSRLSKHPRLEWMLASIDRFDEEGVVEVKTSMSTEGWGEDGSAEVPADVAVQVIHQLAVTRKPVAHIPALLGYREFRIYRMERDLSAEADLIEAETEFIECLRTETPPAWDGSESTAATMRRRWRSDNGTEKVATPEQDAILSDLQEVRAVRSGVEDRERELESRVMDIMGEASRLLGSGLSVSWKRNKDSVKVEWPLVAAGYRRLIEELRAASTDPDAVATLLSTDLEALVSLYTTVSAGARPFRITEVKG